MSEWMKIILTAAVTVTGGVFVFALSQLLQRLVLDPLDQQRRVIADIDVVLTYRAWAYATPGDPDRGRDSRRDEAEEECRHLASRLIATTNAIRWWTASECLGAICREDARVARQHLIGIANRIYHAPGRPTPEWGADNEESARKIRQCLAIPE